MTIIWKAINKTTNFGAYLATLSGIFLSLFVFLAVIMRYIVGSPFGFTEELVGLLFMSMSVLAFAIAEMKGIHIRLEIITNRLKPGARMLVGLFSTVVLLCYCAVFFYHGFKYFLLSYQMKVRTDDSDLLIYPWIIVLLIALVIFACQVIYKTLSAVSNDDRKDN